MYILSLEVVNNCNLNCSYCYLGKKKNVRMDLKAAQKAVEIAVHEAQKQYDKTLVVYFIGGEPLIAFELVKDIAEYAIMRCSEYDLKCIFSITTNGTLITDEVMDYMIANQFELKLSLDGTEEVHNLNRKDYAGAGSFKKIMENLELIQKYERTTGQTVSVAHVITNNNYQFFAQSFCFLFDQGWRKIETGVDHYCEWSQKETEGLEEQLGIVFNCYMNYMKKGEKKLSWNIFEQYVRAYLVPCSFYACKAGMNSIYVATDGNIYTCIELPEFLIGNTEWGLDVHKIREIVYIKDKKDAVCEECQYVACCKARSCFVSNFEVNGDIYRPAGIKCIVTKKVYELIEENIGQSQLDKMKKEYIRSRRYGKN